MIDLMDWTTVRTHDVRTSAFGTCMFGDRFEIDCCWDREKAKVKTPKRPINIKSMINHLPEIDSFEVIPSEKPTVPSADTVSNKISIKLKGSVQSKAIRKTNKTINAKNVVVSNGMGGKKKNSFTWF